MTLPHLLLMTFGTTGLAFLFSWLLSRGGAHASFVTLYGLSLPLAFIVTLLLAWPVARFFRLRPLIVFAGPCPGCRIRPLGWWATELSPERLLLACGACGERLELWLTRKPPADLVSATVRTYRLRWPEFLGIWREVRGHNERS